jgi:hypothetical protein
MNAQRPRIAAPAPTDLDADREHRSRQVRRCPRGRAVVGSMVEHARLNMPTSARDRDEAVALGYVRDRRRWDRGERRSS